MAGLFGVEDLLDEAQMTFGRRMGDMHGAPSTHEPLTSVLCDSEFVIKMGDLFAAMNGHKSIVNAQRPQQRSNVICDLRSVQFARE